MSRVSHRVVGSIFLALGLSVVHFGRGSVMELPSAHAREGERPTLQDVQRAKDRANTMLTAVRAVLTRAGVPIPGDHGSEPHSYQPEADLPAITSLLYLHRTLLSLSAALDKTAADFSSSAVTADIAQCCGLASDLLKGATTGKKIAAIPVAVNVKPADFDTVLTEAQGVKADLKCE